MMFAFAPYSLLPSLYLILIIHYVILIMWNRFGVKEVRKVCDACITKEYITDLSDLSIYHLYTQKATVF